MMQRAIVDLPQPGLADDAERLALLDGEADAVDGLDRGDLLLEDEPARDREVLLEVLDDEQLVGHHARLRHRVGQQLRRPRAPWRLLVEVAACRWSGELGAHGLQLAARRPRTAVNANAQRGWNRQPAGGVSSDGGWPGICTSRSTSRSRRGSEPSSPHVYGWRGSLEDLVDRAPARRPAPRT